MVQTQTFTTKERIGITGEIMPAPTVSNNISATHFFDVKPPYQLIPLLPFQQRFGSIDPYLSTANMAGSI